MNDLFNYYRLPIVLGLIAFILALMIVFIGFFKTLFILIMTLLGILIGFYLKDNESLNIFKR